MNRLSAWERVKLIRDKDRPTVRDYIPIVFEEFTELHGDRQMGDDPAITGGVAFFEGEPVTVLGMVKGHSIEENKMCNFAMPNPEGYRKAIRLYKQAEKFGRPVICLVDTPGAYAGIGAEERGEGEAIARSLFELMRLRTPVVSVILGEGGSGGALALALCDRLAMLENAVYSVISPRGFANILWKDGSREKEASGLLKMTAEDLMGFGVCDEIIPEPPGGAQRSAAQVAGSISGFLSDSIRRLKAVPIDQLLEERYRRYRKIGEFAE